MVPGESGSMCGLWIENGNVQVRHDLPRPDLAEGEVVVDVAVAGICGTDLQLLRGYGGWRGVPGHEFVGRVSRGPAEWLGRRVVADINIGCGQCPTCRSSGSHHCPRRRVIGIRDRPGAFARQLAVPVANLVAVPDALGDDEAVFAEPVAAALRVLDQVQPVNGDPWLVVGDGRLAQLVARVAALAGAEVTMLGRHERKLDRARATGVRVIDAAALEKRAYVVAVDCTGSPSGLATGLAAVRPCGTLVLKSTHVGAASFDATAAVVNEIRLLGSRCGSLGPAIAKLTEGRLEVTDLIDARFPLENGHGAFDRVATPGVLKVLLDVAAD